MEARWFIDFVYMDGTARWVCGNCKGGGHIYGIESEVDQPKVCPNCGAIMTNAKQKAVMLSVPILEGKK